MAILTTTLDGHVQLHGKVGDMTYFVSKSGKQCIRKSNPKRDTSMHPYSENEKKTHAAFLAANKWANEVMQNPERCAHFRSLYDLSEVQKGFRPYLIKQYYIRKKSGNL